MAWLYIGLLTKSYVGLQPIVNKFLRRYNTMSKNAKQATAQDAQATAQDAQASEKIPNDIVTVEDTPLHLENGAFKMFGNKIGAFTVSVNASEEQKRNLEKHFTKLLLIRETEKDNAFSFGEEIDNMRNDKSFDLLYDGAKNVGIKNSFSTIGKILGMPDTTVKENYYLYSCFKKPCSDGKEPITTLRGFTLDRFSKTQLIAVMYAIKNADNVADTNKVALLESKTALNPTLSVKGVKAEMEKVTPKNHKDKGDKGNKDEERPTFDNKLLNGYKPLEFIFTLGNICGEYIKTVKENTEMYKAISDIYSYLSTASVTINNIVKAEQATEQATEQA